MKKNEIWIVTFYSIALFFIGMSIFVDKTSTIGILISIVGHGSLLVASVLSIIRTIVEKRKKTDEGRRGQGGQGDGSKPLKK